MSKLFVVVLLAIVAFAAAFSPVGRVVARASAMSKLAPASMSPSDVAVEATNVLSQFSQTLAAESDFGGYAGPAGSLVLIGVLILALAPPLAEKNAE